MREREIKREGERERERVGREKDGGGGGGEGGSERVIVSPGGPWRRIARQGCLTPASARLE